MAPVAEKPVSEEEIFGLPKWAWAAIAGGVVTAGVLYYIFTGNKIDTYYSIFAFKIIRFSYAKSINDLVVVYS